MSEERYTPEQLRTAKAAAVAHALAMMADHPGNESVKRYAHQIMDADPVDILDTAERLKNPIEF